MLEYTKYQFAFKITKMQRNINNKMFYLRLFIYILLVISFCSFSVNEMYFTVEIKT